MDDRLDLEVLKEVEHYYSTIQFAVVVVVVLFVGYVIVMDEQVELYLIDYLKNFVVDYVVVLVDLFHHLLMVVHLL
jgi:hypothetical protein